MLRSALAVLLLCLSSPTFASNCFWVGGTASMTPANTASWSSSSGGSSGTCAAAGGVPATSSDTATFDGASGGGTVTMNFGGTWTIGTFDTGTFTGTWTNAVNNNNVIFAGVAPSFTSTGSGTRTLNLGTATYTFSGTATNTYNLQGATNLTFTASSSNIVFSANNSQRTIGLNNKSHGNITLGAANDPTSYYTINDTSAGPTIASLTITAPNFVIWPTAANITITNAVHWTGSATQGTVFKSDITSLGAGILVASGSTGSFMGLYGINFVSPNPVLTCTNCALGPGALNVTGIGGGGTSCILGGWLLYRDLPEHINDNYPAWIDKAA